MTSHHSKSTTGQNSAGKSTVPHERAHHTATSVAKTFHPLQNMPPHQATPMVTGPHMVERHPHPQFMHPRMNGPPHPSMHPQHLAGGHPTSAGLQHPKPRYNAPQHLARPPHPHMGAFPHPFDLHSQQGIMFDPQMGPQHPSQPSKTTAQHSTKTTALTTLASG